MDINAIVRQSVVEDIFLQKKNESQNDHVPIF